MILLFVLSNRLFNRPKEYSLFLKAGKYKIECYGAQGGGGYDDKKLSSSGGKGAYVYGDLPIIGKGVNLTVRVGGQGTSGEKGPNNGGFNGGGSGGEDTGGGYDDASGGGGGASDIRYGSGIETRIMVAAGGSGGAANVDGAPGGGLKGKRVGCENCKYSWNHPMTFDCDRYPIEDSDLTNQVTGNNKERGKGGDGDSSITVTGSGGGGGWHGGVSSNETSGGVSCYYVSIAHSGSSYISGYPGCIPAMINNYKFENFGMKVGVKEKDGLVNVTTLYECKPNCGSCSSNENCFECLDSYKLYNNDCYDTCPSGTRAKGSICEACKNSHCSECSSSADICEKCDDNYFLLNENGITSCVDKCKDGYIGTDGKCVECNEKCSTCSQSIDYCDSCKSDNFVYEGNCYSECSALNDETKNDYFGKDNANKKCQKCTDVNCIDCSNDHNQCMKCRDLFYVDETTHQCLRIPTHVFTNSQQFSNSVKFSNSDQFSASSVFSSGYFTKSNQFSKSDQFSNSNLFSDSNQFSKSDLFSNSKHFTRTGKFSNSFYFSNSEQFTKSFEFPQPEIDPSKFSCLVSYENENFTLSERCFFSGTLVNITDITLIRTRFENFINESDGGAIYIHDSSIHFDNSEFINCVSLNGCGGAIYINNTIDTKNDIQFTNLTFTKCKAFCGGAVFICSILDYNNVSFDYCIFDSNQATGKKLDKKNEFYGGSGAFICAKNLYVYKSKFVNNKGSAGGLKIYNNFNENIVKMKTKNYLENVQKTIIVSDCNFELNDASKNSIYYVNGKDGSMINIINCKFNSKLNRIKDHIDGEILSFESPEISIKSCIFQKSLYKIKITFLVVISTLIVLSGFTIFVIKKVSHLV